MKLFLATLILMIPVVTSSDSYRYRYEKIRTYSCNNFCIYDATRIEIGFIYLNQNIIGRYKIYRDEDGKVVAREEKIWNAKGLYN